MFDTNHVTIALSRVQQMLVYTVLCEFLGKKAGLTFLNDILHTTVCQTLGLGCKRPCLYISGQE